MARIPTKLAKELGMKKKVVESYFKPEDIRALIKGKNSQYSYSKIYNILYKKMLLRTLEVEGEK